MITRLTVCSLWVFGSFWLFPIRDFKVTVWFCLRKFLTITYFATFDKICMHSTDIACTVSL